MKAQDQPKLILKDLKKTSQENSKKGKYRVRHMFWAAFQVFKTVQRHIVSYLKDLIHNCLETKVQGHGMIFNVCYIGLKYRYFISYSGLC